MSENGRTEDKEKYKKDRQIFRKSVLPKPVRIVRKKNDGRFIERHVARSQSLIDNWRFAAPN